MLAQAITLPRSGAAVLIELDKAEAAPILRIPVDPI